MNSTEKQTITIHVLFFILVALLLFSSSLMWLQHGQYHSQHETGWITPVNSQNMTPHANNNFNKADKEADTVE